RDPGVRPFGLERLHAPSKWITLRALAVLGDEARTPWDLIGPSSAWGIHRKLQSPEADWNGQGDPASWERANAAGIADGASASVGAWCVGRCSARTAKWSRAMPNPTRPCRSDRRIRPSGTR